jgi:hypothetical protein
MELNFTSNGGAYIAEFEAVSEFNIHIEKESGRCEMYQSTVAGGNYARVESFGNMSLAGTIDKDMPGFVFTKYMRIVSEVLPTKAVVTFPADVQAAIDESIVANLNTPV